MATHAEVRRLHLKLVDVLGLDPAEALTELVRTGHDPYRDQAEAAGDASSPHRPGSSWPR